MVFGKSVFWEEKIAQRKWGCELGNGKTVGKRQILASSNRKAFGRADARYPAMESQLSSKAAHTLKPML